MKINGKEVTGKSFAFDGFHKIYVCETEADENDADMGGYGLYPIDELPDAWERSCPLRFISNWKLTESYVGQFEDAVFEEVGK